MKAIVKTAPEPGALRWTDWPEPALLPGHVVVEVRRAGICSTDVAIHDWTYRGRQPVSIPSMLGHEAAGHIVAVGEGVDVHVGQRVALQVIWGRPHARETIDGRENLDPEWVHIGASRLGGAFAERIAVPWDRVLLLPDAVGWDDAALVEPLAVASNALDLVGVRAGDTVALVGPGPFSLLMLQVARASGASRIVVAGLSGVDRSRLAWAKRLGADEVVEVGADPEADAAAVRDALRDEGADVVVDAGGTESSTVLALDVAAQGARVAVFGFTREARIEPLRQVIRKGLALYGVSAAARRHYGIALRLVERGIVVPSEIVSHRLALSDVAAGIALVKSREATKVLLDP